MAWSPTAMERHLVLRLSITVTLLISCKVEMKSESAWKMQPGVEQHPLAYVSIAAC